MSGDDNSAEAERAEDVMDADEPSRGDELAVQQEIEFSSDMLHGVVVVEEDEVELLPLVGFKEVDRVVVVELDVGVAGAFQIGKALPRGTRKASRQPGWTRLSRASADCGRGLSGTNPSESSCTGT